MSTRLVDRPAILEWLPVEMKTVRLYQPRQITRQRVNFESLAAAVGYATSTLPEAFRHNATIQVDAGITLGWPDIEAMSKALIAR